MKEWGGIMKLSERILSLKTSPVRKLLPYADLARAKGTKIIHLNIGQPDIETPKAFYEAINSYDEKVLKYAHSAGKKELIKEISNYFKRMGFKFTEEEILVTFGGSEALLFVLITLCDVGDEILIPEPYYANYNSFFDMLQIKVKPIRTKPETGFHLPGKEEIRKSISSKTKAIMFSNPGNPTGTVYTREEMNELAEIAKEYNLFIISDEVYREFTYGENKAISFAAFSEISENVIIIDSISKRYSACGARIGCIVSKNRQFIACIYKLCQARLAVSTLEMVGAEALYRIPENYFDEVKEQYENRRNVLYKELKKIEDVCVSEPEGAFYTIVGLPVENAEEFAIWLLKDFDLEGETIMVTPAEGFYATEGLGKNEIRISYAISEEKLKKAVEILKKGLEIYGRIV
jgi:aspartate aminotransferase